MRDGVLSADEIEGLMREMAEESEMTLELGPEYEAYRRTRQAIREAEGEEPPPSREE